MPQLQKVSPESTKAIARNPNINLQSIGIHSRSDIQHHIRTQQFQELLAKMDTIQRQSIDQEYSGFFNDIKDCIYLNGNKYQPQDISPIIIFCFVNLKRLLAFLRWPLEKLTRLYAMFNFFGLLFSLLKEIYNTCAKHTQVNKHASVVRIFFAYLFGIFSKSVNKIF